MPTSHSLAKSGRGRRGVSAPVPRKGFWDLELRVQSSLYVYLFIYLYIYIYIYIYIHAYIEKVGYWVSSLGF